MDSKELNAASTAKVDEIASRRGRTPWVKSPYGKRGGTSATAGRKAVTYEAVLPDGEIVRKRSFFIDQEHCYLGCYLYNDRWHATVLTVEPKGGSDIIFVSATRVS